MPALITWWRQDVATLAPSVPDDAVQESGAELLRRWTEPHRRYHTTRHLVEVFWALLDLGEQGIIEERDVALGRIAAWYHDAIYDVSAQPGHNEQWSAQLAVEQLAGLGFDNVDIRVVRDLVLMTASHSTDDTVTPVARAFHDADLWILAAARERYEEYAGQIREEYAVVPDDLFRTGRSAVLRGFLDRERIFTTAFAGAEWEPIARANLEWELASLSR